MLRIRPLVALACALAAPTASAGVSGRVVTDRGPLAGALVHLYVRETAAMRAERILAGFARTALASARTAADGSFRLDGGLAVADVEVRADGFAPAFGLAAAGEPLTLLLKPARTRRGLVTANGSPLAGAVVAWMADDRIGALSGEVLLRSGPDGSYAVPDPDLWATRVVVSHPAYALADTAPEESSPWEAAQPASLKHDMGPGTTIEGSVIEVTSGRAISGAVLSIRGWPLGRTGADGSFSLRNTPPGWKSIVATTDSLVGKAGAAAGRVVIRVGPARSLSGAVRVAKDGGPIVGALVVLLDDEWEPVASVASDRAGRYQFASLAPGRYRAYAQRAGYSADLSWRRVQDTVDLRRQTSQVRDFALGRLPAIVGRVVDEQGRPIDDASVMLGAPGVPNFYGAHVGGLADRAEATRTSPDGGFTLVSDAAKPGRRLERPLLVFKPGYAAGRLEPSEVRPEQPILVKLSRGVELAGRVMAADGTPLPDVEVAILEAGSFLANQQIPAELLFASQGTGWARSEADGRFATRVHPRPHHLAFRKAAYSPRALSVDTAQRTGLEVVLDPAAEIRGVVVREDGSGVSGVMVRVAQDEDLGSAPASATGDDGSFVVGDLAPGRYELYLYSRERGIGLRRSVDAPSSGLRIELGPTGTIRGRVIDARSRVAVPEFEVTVVTDSDDDTADLHMQRELAVQDAGGAFVVADVPAGEVSVNVSAPGYLSGRLEGVQVGSGLEGGDLEIALEPGATLRGRVTSPEGQAIPDVGVSIQARDQPDHPSAESDENGSYELRGVPPRTVQVEFRKEGFVTARRTVDAAGTARVDATLSRGLSVRGVVLSDGAGLAEASVSLSSSAVDAEYQSASTDEQGRFRITGLAPGRYTIKAEAEGHGEAELQDVDVESVGPLRLVLKRRPSALLAGAVSGLSPEEGLTSVVVVVEGEDGGSEQTPVEPSGAFRMEQAPAGRVKASAYAANPMSGALRSSRVNELVLVPGTENSTVIEFAGDVSLSGTVVRDGAGVPNVRVSFSSAERGGMGWSTGTDASGHYAIAGLEPGRYEVEVMGAGARFSREYTVSGSGDLDIDITGATLRGVVLDASDGSPIRDVEVSFWPVAGRENRAAGTASTNARGEFAAESLREGRYRLLTMKSGYGQQTRDLELAKGSNADVLIELGPAAGVVVSVVDARNERPLDATVVVRDLSGRIVANRHADVGADGSLTIALADGPYLLSTSASGYGTATLRVAAPAQDIRVGLTPGGTLVVESERELRGRIRLVRTDGVEYVQCWCNGIADIEVKGRRTTIPHITPDTYSLELIDEGGSASSAGSVEIREGQVATVVIQ